VAGKMKWKIPDLRRAIQVAHSQGLAVTGCEIGGDGTLTLHTSDQAVAGEVALKVPPSDPARRDAA
jgi:hypothetical protein